MTLQDVLIEGRWQPSRQPVDTFVAVNPRTTMPLSQRFPVSSDDEVRRAVAAASEGASALASSDGTRLASFLERVAGNLEARASALVEAAALETGLPAAPRLRDVELPRTTGQLRQAADAARRRTWQRIVIDTQANLRTRLEPLGPVVVFGPNNFPFAFNAATGGDFAAAIAAGNPVIAKAHPSHPETTRLLAQAVFDAVVAEGLPPATFQMLYHMREETGLALVAHPAIGASAFTGGKPAGLKLKAAADAAGKPIYLELSSINPVFILPGALEERGEAIAGELAGSCTLGVGQFCTNPGLSVVVADEAADRFAAALGQHLTTAGVGVLFGEAVLRNLDTSVRTLVDAGAQLSVGGQVRRENAFSYDNTLLIVPAKRFLERSESLQTEAFGPVHLHVVADDEAQLLGVASALEGNLTGSVYSASDETDDALYERVAALLRPRVGRLLNDKMPTGVAVSPAMHHGGPHPSTGHPGFTSVGLPAAMDRFVARRCYDGVRSHRLPPELRDDYAGTPLWRSIDGVLKLGT